MEYYDLGDHSRRVAAAAEAAQRWFDRGLNWTYGYHHEEAVACFHKAIEADSGCAMAHWGVAYASGPNYNYPWRLMDPAGKAAALKTAFEATARARSAATALGDALSAPERALIAALPARYPQAEPIEDQAPWDDAFADAMRAAYQAHPDDLEITTIFAEAILNRTPWAMWDLTTGGAAAGAGTDEARHVLERAMAEVPGGMRHPGVLHLYVHLMEMSPFPELALKAGDVLRDLVPDAGHLVHMPTHIDVQCGAYHQTLESNQRAVVADRKFLARAGALNFYSGYRIHNLHFAAYGAMWLGQMKPALAAAEELIATVPEEMLRMESPPMADFFESYLSIKQHVLIRFGQWRQIIAQAPPEDPALYTVMTATLHYAKALAHAALGEVAAAEAAQAAFQSARAAVSPRRKLHNCACVDLFEVAEAKLAGEIAYRHGAYEEAFAHLRRGVALDDALPYDEPWGWMQPVRHALGALLLEQGRVEEAEQAYREDLGLAGALPRACVHPDNVWSLTGLHDCLARRGAAETAEGRLIRQRLDVAAARADGPLAASCFCARTAMAAQEAAGPPL